MFDARNGRVSFYSNETWHSYEVRCYDIMNNEDCEEVRGLAASTADRLRVRVFVSRFQELHNEFDYERDLLDAERSETMRYLFKCLRSVGISAYVDGLSWS